MHKKRMAKKTPARNTACGATTMPITPTLQPPMIITSKRIEYFTPLRPMEEMLIPENIEIAKRTHFENPQNPNKINANGHIEVSF